MTSTPKKSTEAEDVLEFLASLPETDQSKLKDLKEKKKNGEGDEDILNFLDELEASEKKGKGKAGGEKSKKAVKEDSAAKDEAKEDNIEVKEDANDKNVDKASEAQEIPEAEEASELPELHDPITSLSNWWSSSGSATVNSFWSNATQQANNFATKAQQEVTKFAKENNIDEETAKTLLNKDVDPSKAIGFLTKNFTNVLNSINHFDEILKIQLIHDFENFSNLDWLLIKNFKKVVKQVQGGIKIELNENHITSKDELNNKRKLNLFEGKLIDGEKLIFANLNNSIKEFGNGNEDEDEVNERRSSNLFISILPIRNTTHDSEVIDNQSNGSFSFTLILKDVTNNIEIIERSQAFPIKWAQWIDGSIDDDKDKKQDKEDKEVKEEDEDEDDEIDPAEWVKDWIDDGLSLAFGILAQNYVVKRMGYD